VVFRNNSISTGSGAVGHLDLVSLFGNAQPVEVDLGCGKGRFLAQEARERRDANFFGIDRLSRKLKILGMRIDEYALTNVRMLRCDAFHFARYLLPKECISVFHIYFPDPWPKKKHKKHRFMTGELVRALAKALVPCGQVWIMTDNGKYAVQIEESFEIEPRFERTDFFARPTQGRTEFEDEFRGEGAEIFKMAYEKRPL